MSNLLTLKVSDNNLLFLFTHFKALQSSQTYSDMESQTHCLFSSDNVKCVEVNSLVSRLNFRYTILIIH